MVVYLFTTSTEYIYPHMFFLQPELVRVLGMKISSRTPRSSLRIVFFWKHTNIQSKSKFFLLEELHFILLMF